MRIDALTSLGEGLGRYALTPEQLAAQADVRPPAPGRARKRRRKRGSSGEADELDGELAAEGGDGWVVMVPFALPGELVRARVWSNRRRHSQADLLSVIVPSSARVAPKCPLFGECGGCQYQHLTYEAQLEWKTRQLHELLRRGGLGDGSRRHADGGGAEDGVAVDLVVPPAVGSPRQYGYRTKLTPHHEAAKREDQLDIGFFAQ